MSAVSTLLIEPTIALFRRHKLKAASIVAFASLSGILIFPYGDLADLASAKVSEATNGSVYLDMESISLALFPSIGATLEKVSIETPSLPTISVASLTAAPSISSLLALRLGASAKASGLFKGDVEIDFSQGEKAKSGQRANNVEASIQRVSLEPLNEFLRSSAGGGGGFGDPMAAMRSQLLSNLNMKGSASGTLRASVDPGFVDPPTGAFDLSVSRFSVDLMSLLGMELAFEKLHLVGKLGEGRVTIERGDFGTAKDELSIKAKGTVDLAIGPGGAPIPGAYDMTIALNASQAAVRRLGLILDGIKAQGAKVETTSDGVTTYRFRATPGAGGMPRYSPAD